MYSESRVRERIELAERELGFPLDYKSVDEVIRFEAHLLKEGKYALDAQGRPATTQNLTATEVRWIQNEQALCACDCAYFLTRYAFLRDEQGVIQRFQFRVPQRIYFDIICDLEERGFAIEIMALKARQLGVSIFSELLISHRVFFYSGVGAVIGSADQTKTGEMSRMMLLCLDMLPVWLRPTPTTRVEGDRGRLIFGATASSISFQHGSQKFGIATGSTPISYHLSEVALYGDAASMLIDEGLWKAVHASPRVFGVLESTGRGDKGWWAGTWYYSKKEWPHSRMFPMFLPWFSGVDIYPTETDRRTRPIPSHWHPDRDTAAHVAKATLYVRSNPLLEKYLIADQKRRGIFKGPYWEMPLDQQWFWEWNHAEAKYKGVEGKFLQEMAGDDIDALQRSAESAFGHETIEVIETERVRQYTAYGISGQSIEEAHEPDPADIDYSAARVPVKYVSHKETYRWELIPLIFDGYKGDPLAHHPLDPTNLDHAVGKLIVFHPPRPNMSYSIGVDTSEGRGLDATAISVWAIGRRGDPDIQCAEFGSPYVNHVEAFSFILAIAAYYGQFMEVGTTRWKEPYVSIEQVAAVGDTAQHQMRKMGYSNFHRFTRYDQKRVSKSRATKLGWYTWSWSRPILLGNFKNSAQNGWMKINSPWLIEEMKTFEVTITASGKEKMEHEEGEHDDRIFAAAMAVFCPHDQDILAQRSLKRGPAASQALPPIDLTPNTGAHMYSASQLSEGKSVDLLDLVYSDSRLERFR
jgi:hypothetical protein